MLCRMSTTTSQRIFRHWTYDHDTGDQCSMQSIRGEEHQGESRPKKRKSPPPKFQHRQRLYRPGKKGMMYEAPFRISPFPSLSLSCKGPSSSFGMREEKPNVMSTSIEEPPSRSSFSGARNEFHGPEKKGNKCRCFMSLSHSAAPL